MKEELRRGPGHMVLRCLEKDLDGECTAFLHIYWILKGDS